MKMAGMDQSTTIEASEAPDDVVLPALDLSSLGPAMRQLTAKQQGFVVAMFFVPPGHGSAAAAARAAGYGIPGKTTALGFAKMGYRLLGNPKVAAAILEEGPRRLWAHVPGAIYSLGRMLSDPAHPHHHRAIGMVLDRAVPLTTHIKTEYTERHVVELDADKAMARIVELARRLGMDPATMPALIEGEVSTEVEDEDDATA